MRNPNLNLEIGLSDKQIEFSDSLKVFDITGYGGAKGGGKSGGGRNVGLAETLATPGLITVLFRKTYPELKDNHLDKLFSEYPGLRGYYNGQEHEIRIPELESYFKFRHCKSMADVQAWAGREVHRVLIEEAGDWPYDMALKLIRNTMRSTVPGIRASAGLLFNWGGVGHSWQKRVFWDKRLRPEERKFTWNFILAKLEDNPWIMRHDPGYAQRLESEPNEALRRAYRDGDPNVLAGQYFEIYQDVHVVKPFPIPEHWNLFCSYDYGFNHPAAWLWFAVDEDGNVYCYRESVGAKKKIHTQAEEFLSHPDHKRISAIHAGHDCWAKGQRASFGKGDDQGPTIAEEFRSYGVSGLTRANINRKQGASQLRNYLSVRENEKGEREGPRLFFFENCHLTIECITRMVHDPNDVEDVLKVDSENGDPETGDDCFVAGTQIETAHGPVPIEKITPGTMVLTRAGWRPVRNIWNSRLSAHTATLTTLGGVTLTGTLNHPIWSGKKFVRLDTMRYGDSISLAGENEWQNRKPLFSMESNFDDTPTLPGRVIESISRLVETTASEVWDLCTSKYGNRFTELFPRDATFIMPTGIHSITTLTTWCASILSSMLGTTSMTQSDYRRLAPILRKFAPWRAPGMGLLLAGNGIVSMPGEALENRGSPKQSNVNSAAIRLIRLIQKGLGSAIQTARQNGGENQVSRTSRGNASDAARSTLSIGSVQRSIAPDFVRDVTDTGKKQTFAIHVDGCHEYYANGILVKNCYDGLRYGIMSRPMLTKPIPKKNRDGWAEDTRPKRASGWTA